MPNTNANVISEIRLKNQSGVGFSDPYYFGVEAENVNVGDSNLSAALSDVRDNINANTKAIEANKGILDDHTTAIETNTNNIKTNADNIKTLTDQTGTNTTNINSNAEAIKALQGRATTDETQIEQNKNNITTNTTNIKNNTDNIADMKNDTIEGSLANLIKANKQSIEAIVGQLTWQPLD